MPFKSVDPKTLKQWIDKEEAIIIDVREPAEHEAEKIDGAILLPLNSISKNALPQTSKKKLVIHCNSGKRGINACEKLLKEDANLELYTLDGGIVAWNKAGLKITRSGRFFIPLDRQVQLAIGLILITASILGTIFSPLWFVLTGFVGLGLAFSGLTGFCGLAIFMAKMPWNQKASKPNSCPTN